MVFPVLGHITFGDLLQLGRTDEDVHVGDERRDRDEANHHCVMHAVLKLVPLETRRCDEEIARSMVGHGATDLQLKGCSRIGIPR